MLDVKVNILVLINYGYVCVYICMFNPYYLQIFHIDEYNRNYIN